MLTLICGSAVAPGRAQRLSLPLPSGTLFVVPDDLAASAFTREIYGSSIGTTYSSQILTFDAMTQWLVVDRLDPAKAVPPEVERAAVRNIIDADSKAFDYLVGRHSVPQMSQGILDRILSALQALSKTPVPSDSEAEAPAFHASPRSRQLKLLADKLEERLSVNGYRLQKHAELEALSSLSQQDWDEQFPDIRQVVFLDFLHYSDLHYMLVAAVARHIERCDVLLDYDPEHDRDSSAMDAVYQRLYDIAEHIALVPEDLPVTKPAVSPPPVEDSKVVVVKAGTIATEISSAAAAINRMVEDATDDEPLSFVVALANWGDYAQVLQKELDDFGIQAVWEKSDFAISSGAWLLIQRLRDCCTKFMDAGALSALFRAPGFHNLLPGGISSVETWDAASRLDYVVSLSGRLQGWKAIMDGVSSVLQSLREDLRRGEQWSEEEALAVDNFLLILGQAKGFLEPYCKKGTIAEWSELTAGTIRGFGGLASSHTDKHWLALRREILAIIHQLSRFGPLVSADPVSFSYYVTLLRTALQGIYVKNEADFQTLTVTVCSPSTAARLRSDCCMVLGCNDGNFPKFARPEASLQGNIFATNQAAYRAGQRLIVDHLMRNHPKVLFWTASKLGTEDLLPSQLIEELLDIGRSDSITAADLLSRMKARSHGKAVLLQKELVDNLKGLVLTGKELQRFQQRGNEVFNIASNMSVTASRNQAQLAGFDGIIEDPQLKAWLQSWADRHIYSVSQLDSIVGCSFRFFVDRLLNLEEVEETDDLLPAHVFGSLTHDVLARFYRGWVAAGRGVPHPEEEGLAREALLEAYLSERGSFPDVSRFAHDLLNLKLFGDLGSEGFGSNTVPLCEVSDPGILGQFLLMEMERGASAGADFLQPANFEVGFGMGRTEDDDPLSQPAPIEIDLATGMKIRLRGRIDRIDVSADEVFGVTDYKTGKLPEKREILGGYRTQLPVYTMIAEQLLREYMESPEPAGGLYYSLRKGKNANISGVFFRGSYLKQAGVSGRGIKDEEFEAAIERVKDLMRHSLKAVKKGYMTTTRHDPGTVCKFCPFDGFCYKDVERTERFWQGLEALEEESLSAP